MQEQKEDDYEVSKSARDYEIVEYRISQKTLEDYYGY